MKTSNRQSIESIGYSRSHFGVLVQRSVKDRLGSAVIDLDSFKLSHENGTTFLEGYYQHFLLTSEDVHDYIVDAMVEEICQPRNVGYYQEVKNDILPCVSSGFALTNRKLTLQASGLDPVEWIQIPIVPNFLVYLVVDRPLSRQLLSAETLDQWSASSGAVYSASLANLDQLTRPVKPYGMHSGVFHSSWQDSYDASRLLLSPNSLSIPISDPVIMPITDNYLLASNSDSASLREISEVALEIGKEDPSLIVFPYFLRKNGDGWKQIEYNGKSNKELLLLWHDHLYSDQHESLRKIFKNKDTDPFISTFNIIKSPKGLKSYSTWTEGVEVEQWLPKTDLIALVSDTEETEIMEWDEVESVVGKLKRETQYGLDRFIVKEYPRELLLKLQARST